MSILVNIMEYIKSYSQNLIIFPSLTIIFGGFFTRKFYQNKELLKEIEYEKMEIENIKKNEIEMLKYEIQQLKKENVKLTSENEKETFNNEKLLKDYMDVCSKLTEKDKILEDTNKKLEDYYRDKIKDKRKTNLEDYGSGSIRYKSKCGTIYYHGMGHLENKYVWWEPHMNHKIIEYKNKEKVLKYPEFQTHDISSFCNNCEYCEDINKKRRNKFYYECKGHKLNVE
jgi:hypothetical protein